MNSQKVPKLLVSGLFWSVSGVSNTHKTGFIALVGCYESLQKSLQKSLPFYRSQKSKIMIAFSFLPSAKMKMRYQKSNYLPVLPPNYPQLPHTHCVALRQDTRDQ